MSVLTTNLELSGKSFYTDYLSVMQSCPLGEILTNDACSFMVCKPNTVTADVQTLLNVLVGDSREQIGLIRMTLNKREYCGGFDPLTLCEAAPKVECNNEQQRIQIGGIRIAKAKSVSCEDIYLRENLSTYMCGSQQEAQRIFDVFGEARDTVFNSTQHAKLEYLFDQQIFGTTGSDGLSGVIVGFDSDDPNSQAYVEIDSQIQTLPSSNFGGTSWNTATAEQIAFAIHTMQCDTDCCPYDELWMNCETLLTLMQGLYDNGTLGEWLCCNNVQQAVALSQTGTLLTLAGVTIRTFNGKRQTCTEGVPSGMTKWFPDNMILARCSDEGSFREYRFKNNARSCNPCEQTGSPAAYGGKFVLFQEALGSNANTCVEYSDIFQYVPMNPNAFKVINIAA